MDIQFSTKDYEVKKENIFPSALFKTILLIAIVLLMGISFQGLKQQKELNTLLKKEIEVEQLSDDIIYFDEVLTMSARLAVLTGEQTWMRRYFIFEKKLDATLKAAKSAVPQTFNLVLESQSVSNANTKLVQMETQAFEFLKRNKKAEARSLLFSQEYKHQKKLYADGMHVFQQKVHHLLENQGHRHIDSALHIFFYIGVCVVVLILFSLLLFRRLTSWQQKLNEELYALYRNSRNYHLILSSAGEGIYGLDNKGRAVFVNQTACQILGYTKEELIGKLAHEMIHYAYENGMVYPKEKCPISASFTDGTLQRVDNEVFWSKSGKAIPVSYTTTPIFHEDRIEGAVVTFLDTTKEQKAKAKLEQQAHFDTLTGLPNRRSLMMKVEEAIYSSQREGVYFAVMFIDLDDFKTINDTKGHDFGDKVIIELGDRIKNSIRKNDFLARLGGDEFAAVFEHFHEPEYVGYTAQNILSNLQLPLLVDGKKIMTSVSLGIAVYPIAAKTPIGLLKKADIAMYRAKELGKNQFVFYSERLNKRIDRIQAIERGLQQAIDNNELEMYYQGVVDNEANLVSVEALVRWHNEELGNPSPAEFIPIAEKTQMINKIGIWVIERTLKDLIELQQSKTFEKLRGAINISAKQFAGHNFLKETERLIRASGLSPEDITFELTETALMSSMQETSVALEAINNLGARIALDDFGTGYSSMLYLKKLPLHYLKIDREFVRDIGIDKSNDAIIRSMLDLAKCFNLIVIAEGVETEAQVSFLKQYGCDLYQGYYYCKPLTKQALIDKFGQ